MFGAELLAVLLRCIGAFYLVAAIFGLRAVAMDAFLTQALDSLAPGDSSDRAADRITSRYLVASTILTGLGAIALLALLSAAFPLFLLTSAMHIGFLAIVAPRFVDKVEPADPGGRRRSWMAAAVYGAATAFVGAAAWTGLLRPVLADPFATSIAGFGALAFAGYALWLMKPWSRLPRLRPEPGSPDAARPFDDGPEDEPLPDLELISLVLTPSWDRGGVLDAATGRPLPYRVEEALLTEEERALIADWLCLFREVGDPADPRRCGLADASGLGRLEELGRPIYEQLSARLGPGRVRFEPQPRPREPNESFRSIKVMAEYASHPLWHRDGEIFGCIHPEDAGISWSLARQLDEWSMDYDESLDRDDPGGASRWTPSQRDAHAETGRGLARKLRDELRATGRERVAVFYQDDASNQEVPVEALDQASGR